MIYDNFLVNPCRVRRIGLSANYIDWRAPDGEIYKRVAIEEVPGFRAAIESHVGPVEILGMGYRLNYGGETPNAAIHSDMGWGTHAAVLYLCDGPGGTAFWEHKETGASSIKPGDMALLSKVQTDWDDAGKWTQRGIAELKFNRCVIYPSELFHSRWPFEAFGDCPANGRLIAVAFFNIQ